MTLFFDAVIHGLLVGVVTASTSWVIFVAYHYLKKSLKVSKADFNQVDDKAY